jgi:putative nucleotidyltransferase with HDIG domain
MSENNNKTAVARRVELIIRRLNTLSTLPQVAAGILPHVLKPPFNTPQLAEMIESDAAMTAGVLALANRLKITNTDGHTSLAQIIDAIPPAALRDAVLSVRVVQVFDDQTTDLDAKRPLPRKQLALHTLAVACASAAIAQLALDEPQRGLAFTAGLLHDIGKAALDEVMPKSFEQLVVQARQKQQSLAAVEQEHLGLTHALIGKRLAEKWYLPEPITQAIWLHHAEPQILPEMPGGRLVMVVALADNIARKCGVGHSGSCDTPDQIEILTQMLGLTSEQIDQISSQLAGQVQEKSKWLNVSEPGRSDGYYEMIHQTAAQLAQDNSKLTQQSQRSLDTAVFAEPLREFLVSLSSGATPDQVAGQFAVCFQKTFQTGPVMVLLWPQDEAIAEVAIADRDGQLEATVLPVPDTVDFKTNPFMNGFTVVAAAEFFGWCVQQSQYPIVSQTLAAPLLLAKTPVAAVIWEDQKELPTEALQMLCSVGAAAISTSIAFRNQREQAEHLVELMSKLRETSRQLSEAQALSAIAEMAAGAAHELNNPLAVISGRAQLLQQTETDPNKKQILEQIGQRTGDISDIITDLMAFARPRQPQKNLISPMVLISEAMEKTAARHKIQKVESETVGVETAAEVFVDKQQVVQTIGYLLDNALDSYPGGNGPIRVESQNILEGRNVEIRIGDRGCGMDEATLSQATKPFFSARPAGRKRGMGLAHARRLLVLNGGSLQLVSQPGKGTTVIISLPRA